MLKLKTAISILALLLVTFAAVAATGAFAPVGLVLSASTVAILMAVSQGASVFGVSLYQFQPPIPAYLSWAGGILTLIQITHAAKVGANAAQSVGWVIFGCAGVLVSNLGKSPIPHAPTDEPPQPPKAG